MVPENVNGLEVSVEAALLTKFPLRSIVFVPALKVPFDKVSMPLIVMLLPRVTVPVPVFDKLASAVVLLGSSDPVVIAPEVYTTL